MGMGAGGKGKGKGRRVPPPLQSYFDHCCTHGMAVKNYLVVCCQLIGLHLHVRDC